MKELYRLDGNNLFKLSDSGDAYFFCFQSATNNVTLQQSVKEYEDSEDFKFMMGEQNENR